jgi:hypothetical protein
LFDLLFWPEGAYENADRDDNIAKDEYKEKIAQDRLRAVVKCAVREITVWTPKQHRSIYSPS